MLELIVGWGKALEPEGGSKCNAIADTRYKALTRTHWICPSDDDWWASRNLILLEMEARLPGVEDWYNDKNVHRLCVWHTYCER